MIEGLLPSALQDKIQIRVCRHTMSARKDKGWSDFDKLLMFDNELLVAFTGSQSRDVFKSANLILSFVKTTGTKCILRGAFWSRGEIGLKKFAEKFPAYLKLDKYKSENGLDRINPNGGYFYDIDSCEELQPLVNRLVIEWGESAQQWVQKKIDKPVFEIKPYGFVEEFPGWNDVLISHQALKAILSAPEANAAWYNFLSANDGVYTIRDKVTNRVYVGSASSADKNHGGIWGRWLGYVNTGHNNNKGLVAITKNDSGYASKNFLYSIHYVIPRSPSSSKEVLHYERLLKEKLGTREGVDKLNFN